jgi:hypothetical protein
MRRRLVPALAALMLLSACETEVFGSSEDTPTAVPPPCPRVVILDDAGRLTRFQGAGRDVTDVSFEAEIQQLRSGCVYREREIAISLVVPIVVARGPANQEGEARFNYFVAIARGNQILARSRFDAEVPFEGNQTRVGYVDELAQTIPLQGTELGNSYVVYVGIELTPAEMDFNRQR